MDNWIILTTYVYPHEAHVVMNFLESEGINTIIKDELTAQVNNFYSGAIGGVKILINEADYEKGVQALERGGYIKPDKDENKIENISVDSAIDLKSCPFCKSKNIGKNKDPNLLTLFVYFILGVLFPIFRTSYLCFDCGKKWKFLKK